MQILDNLPIRAKTLVSPVLGCLLAVLIGGVLFMSSNNTTDALNQSTRSRELSGMMTSAEIALAVTHTELCKALNWKQTSVEDKLIDQTIKGARTSLKTAKMLISRIDSDYKEVDQEELKKNYHRYKGL